MPHTAARHRAPYPRRRIATLIAILAAGLATAALPGTAPAATSAPLSDPLAVAQAQLAGCQAWLALHSSSSAQHTRMVQCVSDEQAIITALLAQPSPTPTTPSASPTATPTGTPSGTPTVSPTPSVSPSGTPTPSPTATTPSPTPTTPSPTPTVGPPSWPGPGNTGVPAGTVLTAYTGPCTINTATTIDAKTINCGTLFINAPVVITRSKINGAVSEDFKDAGSIRLDQVEVDAGQQHNAAVGNTNVTVLRSNIHGAAASVQCGSHCTVADSWLHGQYAPDGSWHDDAFITNGGTDMTLTHNTLACDDQHGACTADLFLAADFDQVSFVTATNNLLAASPNVQYCTYGGANRLGAHDVSYIGNVFQYGANGLCGKFGPTTILGGANFIWANNIWEDGRVINP